MAGKTIDLRDTMDGKEPLAEEIAEKFHTWNSLRRQRLDEQKEIRNYIFATDTRTTQNQTLPWKNSTTVPKLTQIRDNLHANYMAALFPNDDWLSWEGETEADASKVKRQVIEAYMKNKTRLSKFKTVVSKWVYDWIDFGECLGTVEYIDETRTIDGEDMPGYVGPRAVRFSPYDVVYNPAAPSFDQSPTLIRSLKSMGEVLLEMETHPERGWLKDTLKVMKKNREKVQSISESDTQKDEGYVMDGFSSLHHYYSSGQVELIEFVGTIYDHNNEKLYRDHIITVADRMHIVRMQPIPTWRGKLVRKVNWRDRSDNLYGMGPLDNLVGMQYRIDHLENLKADMFDLVAFPMTKIKGTVDDFEYGPNERIYVGDDGDVEFMSPDTTALNADVQIRELEARMEELAGAPRQAMGIRTPGEKTAFEVDRLENAAGRIFQSKSLKFEIEFMEDVLNDMLELSRHYLTSKDVVKVINDELGIEVFKTVTKDDLRGVGKIYPQGARHFAQKARLMQNLSQLVASPMGQDPAVMAHFSGKKLAKLIEETLELEKYGLYQENVRVFEQLETQQLTQIGQFESDGDLESLAQAEGVEPRGREEGQIEGAVDQAP